MATILATFQRTYRASVCIGDAGQQEKLFKELHVISAMAYLFALVCWSMAVILMPNHGTLNGMACVLTFLGMVAGFILTCSAHSLKRLLLSGAVSVVFTSLGFRANMGAIHDPSFWVLPLGLLITLTMAPIFSGLVNYLSLFFSVWLIIGAGYFPVHAGLDDHYWPALTIMANLVIAVVLNVSFHRLRLKNYSAQAVLATLAFTDSLTGLNNRRKFTRCAQALHQDKSGNHYFFLMLDIDDFKKINDTFGHDKGDEVLQKIAAILAEICGPHLCGRLGGEEFGIIYAGNPLGVRTFATQLLRAVTSADVDVTSVSISIGIAGFDQHTRLEDCYKSADEALYLAKQHGKNQFHHAADEAADRALDEKVR